MGAQTTDRVKRPGLGDAGRIEVSDLSKRYGELEAVRSISFVVEPGRVTGFLGPNGAGKTTTLRMLLGLVRPTAGTATIGGVTYAELPEPGRVVGAVLEASAAHRLRTGRDHLRVACVAMGLPRSRADETLSLVGLTAAADRAFHGYSLGMRQRLGIATALLGDPAVLILDEPANGLDPEGIRWMRELLQRLAVEGRTVLVSSHLLSEMQALADDVVILAAGQLVRQGPIAEVLASMTDEQGPVTVKTPRTEQLTRVLEGLGATVMPAGAGRIHVAELSPEAIGDAALDAGIALHRLWIQEPDLEDAFLKLTHGAEAIR